MTMKFQTLRVIVLAALAITVLMVAVAAAPMIGNLPLTKHAQTAHEGQLYWAAKIVARISARSCQPIGRPCKQTIVVMCPVGPDPNQVDGTCDRYGEPCRTACGDWLCGTELVLAFTRYRLLADGDCAMKNKLTGVDWKQTATLILFVFLGGFLALAGVKITNWQYYVILGVLSGLSLIGAF